LQTVVLDLWSRAGREILDLEAIEIRGRLEHSLESEHDRVEGLAMTDLDRITFDPAVMGGKACIRGLRVTVSMILGLLAAGRSRDEILAAYPYLEPEDIDQALGYAAWRLQEQDAPLAAP
jgi:uncharacterized protein (DUF433 family)